MNQCIPAATNGLRITSLTPIPGAIVAQWTSETNAFTNYAYQVAVSTNLGQGFSVLTNQLPASQPFNTFTDYTSSAAARFYRIQAPGTWAPLTEPRAWDAYDASHTSGLTCDGYVGAAFDGRYVYFCPYHDGTNHGRVLRLDTQGNFTNSSSWLAYDAGRTGGANATAYNGTAFDGRYVYFVPNGDGSTNHAPVLRLDTQGNFTNSASWQVYDAGFTDNTAVTGFQGGGFDGRYVYFVPHFDNTAWTGKVLRYDTQSVFTNATSWHVYDAGHTDGLNTKGYSSSVFDGRYLYFVPVFDGVGSHGRVLRYDSQGVFTNAASWHAYDAGNSGVSNTIGFKGGVFDGRYIYFVPFANGTSGTQVLRLDTQANFTNAAAWSGYDAANTDMLGTIGYVGGAFDGRYVYFVPYRSTNFSGVVLRFDARLPRQIPVSISGGSFF